MIINHETKIVIATPPHTASRALHMQSQSQLWGKNPDGLEDHHYYEHIDGYTVEVIVRNPYDRLVALWHHLVDWNAYHGDGCCSFVGFLELVSAKSLSWMYCYSICDWAKFYGLNLDQCIQVNYPEVFSKYNLKFTPKERRHWSEYYSKSAYELVRSLHPEDCERFGSL